MTVTGKMSRAVRAGDKSFVEYRIASSSRQGVRSQRLLSEDIGHGEESLAQGECSEKACRGVLVWTPCARFEVEKVVFERSSSSRCASFTSVGQL